MPSRFGWVDFSENDRQRMLDVMKLFSQRDTRDELGIGTIRDALADYLFPGTSTIQTRARYFLFVPWIYQAVVQRASKNMWTSRQIAHEVTKRERRLIYSLESGGEKTGVIGIEAKDKLQRFPSSIYWSGLGALSIRLFQGSQAEYHRYLSDWARNHTYYAVAGMDPRSKESDETEPSREPRVWHPGIPESPDGLMKEASLSLTSEEAQYLRDRVLETKPDSLFAAVLKVESATMGKAFFWEHPVIAKLNANLRSVVQHARNFSELLHGASLQYNLILAREAKDDKLTDEYSLRMGDWATSVTQRWSELVAWYDGLSDFWTNPAMLTAHIPLPTKTFVNRWLALVMTGNGLALLPDNEKAQNLIRDRERFLKGKKRARLSNPDARARWSGASGTAQLDYRWRTARAMLDDIFSSLETKGGADA